MPRGIAIGDSAIVMKRIFSLVNNMASLVLDSYGNNEYAVVSILFEVSPIVWLSVCSLLSSAGNWMENSE